MTGPHMGAPVTRETGGAVRHFIRAVGKTADMHRVSGRAERRARAHRGWAR
jgi:hypothetical protein